MKCKICNTSNTSEIQNNVFKCSHCNHVYINYVGDGNHYHKVLYRSNGEGSRGLGEIVDGRFTESFHNRRDEICNKRVKELDEYFTHVDSLLDIGAGGGTFLNKVRQKIKTVEGTEISDVCVENLRRDGYKIYHGSFTEMQIDKKYDLVTCWHVLEHIKDVNLFPSIVHSIVNKYLVLEVPINRKFRNPDIDFDGHFHYFSEDSMRILFQDLFEITYIGPGIQQPCLLVKMLKK